MLRIVQGIETTDGPRLARLLRVLIAEGPQLSDADTEALRSVAAALDTATPSIAGIRGDYVCKPSPGEPDVAPSDAEIVAAYRSTANALLRRLPRSGHVVEACFSVVVRHRETLVPRCCRNCDEVVGPDGRCDCTRTEARHA